MDRKIDLRRAVDELTVYAAQRLADFEQQQPGSAFRQPEIRNEWIWNILRGMAEVNGLDGGELTARFDQQLETVSGCGCVELLPTTDQKHVVQSLREYVSALEQLDGDQRARLFSVRDFLEDVCAYLPWDVNATNVYPARDDVERALRCAVAQRPIRFTRVLLGGDLDPGGIEFMSGLVDDTEGVRNTQEFQRLMAEYPGRDEWPALCTVYLGGGQQMAIGTVDVDELDMKVIREAADQFLRQPDITPVCTRQLHVPVYKQIRVLKVEPSRPPEEITMPNTLEAFQAAVGGYIEVLDLGGDTLLVCNEEGKLVGLPANRRVCGDTIAGTFLITGSADGEFCSLSDEDAAHYAKEFEQPMPVYGSPDTPTQWEFHVF